MLRTEPVPIENFVSLEFGRNTVAKLIANWRIEPETLIQIIISHHREMGVFFVYPQHEKVIQKSIINALKSSPEVVRLLRRAEMNELTRQWNNRHHGE